MIYIVRHGQTDFNVSGRYGGRIDTPLNEKGISQAYELHELLKDIKFDLVFSSPLNRAYQTASIICNNEIIKDNRIIERDNGELEGKLKTEIKVFPDFNDPNETRYNIENIVDFRNRIYDFFKEISEKYSDVNILVVTHAGVGIYARCFFEGEPFDGNYMSYKLGNCEVLKYDNSKKEIKCK
jgi:broad specificity phosphatase PhoE